MACITTAALITARLPKGVIVEPTRKDYIKVLAHTDAKGRKVKESIVMESFKAMLKKGIIVAVSEPKKEGAGT